MRTSLLILFCAASLAAQNADTAKSVKAKPDLGPMHKIEFVTDEGTWMSVDVSPDGRTIAFDLLGDIYTVPITGGEATLLLGGRTWDQQPRFSRDGKHIAFISDRDGMMNLWIANADGSGLKQMSREATNESWSPLWSPDGLVLVWRRTPTPPGKALHAYYVDGGSGFRLPVTSASAEAAFTPDGRYLFVDGLRRIDLVANDSVTIGAGSRPQVSPDGRWLAYIRPNDSYNAVHLRDLRTGLDRRLVSSIGLPNTMVYQPGYAFTPDSKAIILSIDGKINRVDVATGQKTIVPFRARVSQEVAEPIHASYRMDDGDVNVRTLRWPSFSADGRRVVFGAVGKIWGGELPGGPGVTLAGNGGGGPAIRPRRLTTSGDREYSPAYSPDGKWIAYTTWNDTTFGNVMIISPSGGSPRQVTTDAGRYANVVWSRDGRKLAFVRSSGAEERADRQERDPYFDIMWVSADGGEPQVVTTMLPSRALGFPMRYYPVIAFNPDGSRILYNQWNRSATPGGVSRTTLYSVRLDGLDKRGLLTTSALDEIVPAPDGKHVAFVKQHQVIVSALPALSTTPIDLNLESSPAVPVTKITNDGGNYVAWLDSNTITWSFNSKLYRQKLTDAKAELIGDVNLSLPRAKPSGTIAFTNARVITMKGDEVLAKATIVVENNRIKVVGPSAQVRVPNGAAVVDASGKTIMPGIVDAHAHMHYAAFEAFPQTKWEYVANLAYGVTTTYDPSAHTLDVFAQQEMVETGEMLGPRIYSSGDILMGDETAFPVVYIPIKGVDDARAAIKRLRLQGSTMIKSYLQLRRDQRQWIAQAAREEGILLTAEGTGDYRVELSMLLDGFTAWEHALSVAPLYKDVVELVARSKVHYTPTLIVAYGGQSMMPYFSQKSDVHDDPKLRRFTPEDDLDSWRRWQHIPEEEWHWIDVSKGAAAITKAGGLVTLGAHGNRQGLGAQWELWGLQMGGLTNMQALRQATITAAQKVGFDRDVGSIEVGKMADFLVLDANPLDDIRNTATLRYTVKNGFVYDSESMTRVWPDRATVPRAFWQSPEDYKRFAAPLAKIIK